MTVSVFSFSFKCFGDAMIQLFHPFVRRAVDL